MSLWWARRDHLDPAQMRLIEDLPIAENHLVIGPPGSGKTNVLLRRAQYVRTQGMPNVMVLTFTRALTEFVKTGCFDGEGREIFPLSCVSTYESWIRYLYAEHDQELPTRINDDLRQWKSDLASGALAFRGQNRLPSYEALFIDECQDLLNEEIALLRKWGERLYFVGDDRQKIYNHNGGFHEVNRIVPPGNVHALRFHYRLAPEICSVADRIMAAQAGNLRATSHYNGPRPGQVNLHPYLSRQDQLERCAARLKEQLRIYADFIKEGDLLGVVVARTADRQAVFDFLEQDPALAGRCKLIRARTGDEDDDHDPTMDGKGVICVLTVQACKGLEFRAVHWLFAEQLQNHHGVEHYYTVVTRAKTSLDVTSTNEAPQTLARSVPAPVAPW